MIISNGWAEAHWWKKAILSPGQPTCSRHVCVPALGLPGPNASSPTSTPAAGILPTLEATAPISPAENQVTCIWPLMAFCLLLGDLEPWPYVPSSAYHSLRAGVTSYSITVPTVGACKYLLKERKIRGEWEEISAVLKTSPWRGALKPGVGPITPPLNLGDLCYQAVLLGNHKKGWKIN